MYFIYETLDDINFIVATNEWRSKNSKTSAFISWSSNWVSTLTNVPFLNSIYPSNARTSGDKASADVRNRFLEMIQLLHLWNLSHVPNEWCCIRRCIKNSHAQYRIA
uniref:Uncharacterized protein n=1 Tax=Romanomermis culicivorax TaxID=13658 RepID=A0A915JY15_ROMCU